MNNIQTYILIGAGLLLIIFFMIFAGILPGTKPAAPPKVTLEFWGVEDDDAVWRDILDGLKTDYPHISVTYRRFDAESYEGTLINRLAEGTGPDVFFLKNSWVIKHKDKIHPLPQKDFDYTARDFRREFADIAASDMLGAGDEILGLPLFIDTLALFYNKDIFNSSGVASPPATWKELLSVSDKVTKRDDKGMVIRGGLALGNARNVENYFEIISILILQNGDSIVGSDGKSIVLEERAKDAVEFYRSFANIASPNFSGNLGAKSSLDALADGSVAMAIGFSRDLRRIRAKNPHINLGIAPLPQVADSPVKNYGSYYFPIVSKLSKNQKAAWDFLFYVSSHDTAKKYLGLINRSASRRDLIAEGSPTDELDVFYAQSLSAKSWPILDEASARRIFRDMIESAGFNETSINQAVNRAREQLRLLLP